jgi:hypothetical protein
MRTSRNISHIKYEWGRAAVDLDKSAQECALVQDLLSYLTFMVIGAEWLSAPDVPVTIKVT